MKITSYSKHALGTTVAMLGLIGGLSLPGNAQDQLAPPPVNAAPTLPPGVYPSSPLAQVIKLMEAGVSEGVIMTYVTNSGSTFNLDSDRIIYLKDIGVPDGMVTAMMQRDQEIKAQISTASAYQPPTPTETLTPAPVQTEIPAEQPAAVTVDYFYDTLAPYGNWVEVDGYGRCWRPMVVVSEPGWQPYSNRGHWVYTDAGWYWMSDYSWGWAAFHYGRWFHHERFGWCWTPDTVWGPSWVTWRYTDDYCGWAPLPPRAVYREGIGFFYNGAAVSVGFDFGLSVGVFTFVHTRDFCDPHPWQRRVESREVTQIFNRTTIINNYDVDRGNRSFINHGIDPDRIRAVTRTEIHPVAIHEATAPVSHGEQLGRDGRTLLVNRPNFDANPRPSGRGTVPPGRTSSPAVGSPAQPQPSRNGNDNNNSQPPRRYLPAMPAPTPEPRQNTPGATPSSPGRNNITPPADRSNPPGNRNAQVTPVTPAGPNYNSIDTRRYPSPRMQQAEQPGPRGNSGNIGAPVVPSPSQPPVPAQPPQRSYSAPVTPPSPPARQPEASRSPSAIGTTSAGTTAGA